MPEPAILERDEWFFVGLILAGILAETLIFLGAVG
jgi:hypothetical protein